MKSIRNFAFAVALVLSVAAAQAQSKLAANIPFNFQVGDRQMNAGHYTADVEGKVLTMRGRGQGAVAMAHSGQDKKASESTQCKLVFRRNGGSLYLAEIWSPTLSTVARLNAPKHAQIVARNATTAGPDEVVIYAELGR